MPATRFTGSLCAVRGLAIAQISGVVRGARRPQPIQQRDHVGLPAVADLGQDGIDVGPDGVGGCAAVRRDDLHRLAGGQAPGDARLGDRKSTRLNSSHLRRSRMPSSA